MRGNDLKRWRKKYSLTQKNCGSVLGLAMRTIQDYESEARPIPQSVMRVCGLIDELAELCLSEKPLKKVDLVMVLAERGIIV